MKTGDFPSLRMRVEGGRLVPATQFDQERLNSYRNGAIVMCKFTEERDRVLIRKWWAILGLVVKQCKTPWKNVDEAHEAIKLALGIVNLSKTISGQFMQYPKSLKDLEDPEMLEALENMTELLSRMTGVDVSELKKQTKHVEDDEIKNTIDDEGVSSMLNDEPISVDHARTDDNQMPDNSSSTNPDRELLILCANEMFSISTMPGSSTEERREALIASKDEWKAKLPERAHETLRHILTSTNAVSNGKADKETSISVFADLLECSATEIGGAI